jgi:hypothetical protein
MKKNRLLTAFALAVLLLAGGVSIWLISNLQNSRPAKNHAPDTARTRTPPILTTGGTSAAISPASQSSLDAQQRAKIKDGKRFGLLPLLSAAKIEFYGKVIDQDGNALAGVDVTGRTGSKVGFMQDETRSYATKTDANGFFAFSGFNGDGLVIDLKKEGYNFGSSNRQFLYSLIDPDHKRFLPDKDNPVVFQMWKRSGAEPMIHYFGADLGRIKLNQMPIRIDLENGKIVKLGGDMIVDVKWENDHTTGYDFNWSVTLELPEGGILEGESDIRFMAPLEGYKSKLEYKFWAKAQSDLRRTFYVKSKNGQDYSRIHLSVANQPGAAAVDLTLSTWLNPSGSRNLEYDPTKKINP